VSISVPSNYVPLLQEMAKATGIPYNVEAAQANDESGFNPNAVSSAGAEGWLQFLPSTYNGVAAAAGVQEGTEFNPGDEAKAYDVYMKQLLNEEGGNVQDALAAYNAGPGNIAGGMGYANSILAAAGVPGNITAGPAAGTGTLDSANLAGSSSDSIGSTILGGVLSALGLSFSDITDILERGALMIFGAILVIVGIIRISGGSATQKKDNPVAAAGPAAATPEATIAEDAAAVE
jgi:hypothetical protein